MKKTKIATKQTKKMELHQVILILDFTNLTIQRKNYYDGKISSEEILYYDNDYIFDISRENELKYYKDNEYNMIDL